MKNAFAHNAFAASGGISQTAADARYVIKAGGAFSGLTTGGFRDTSAAYDVTLGFASSVALTAGRALTVDMGNVAHTIALGTTAGAITFPNAAAVTVAALQVANVFTAAQSISVAGAASTPALHFTGAILTGGTGTTNFPHVLIQPTGATAATTWSTSGTAFGVNLNVSGGNYFDGKIDGVTTFKIDAATGAASVYTYNAINWAVYDSVGGTLRSYEQGGVWRATDGFNTLTNNIGLQSTYSGLRLRDTFRIGWSADSTFYGTNDLSVGRKAAATLRLGEDAAGVTNQMLTAASRITSDGVGANLTIAGGNGRGGAGGTLILSTYDTQGAATIGVLQSRMTIDTAGAVAFPVVTAVTTETVVSDRTWPVTINGVAYKICLKV